MCENAVYPSLCENAVIAYGMFGISISSIADRGNYVGFALTA
jgi:hypothetical protein